MNRFSDLIATSEDDFSSTIALNSNQPHFDDTTPSLYQHNSQCSDSESISDDSRKIRKKRNTYHKISDDIRMELLDAVNNGETLKSAAKRFEINYSSAKSILHTYRREGRILKKSAQERITKKKVSSEECSISKSVKSKKTKTIIDYDLPLDVAPYAERTASMTTCASLNDESSPMPSSTNLNDNFTNTMKSGDNYTLNEQTVSLGNSDYHFPEVSSQVYNNDEFVSLNSWMNAFHRKPSLSDDLFNDPTAFTFSKCFTPTNAQEQKTIRFDGNMDTNDNVESTPFKSFLETQNLLREAFRKASIASYNGNCGYRKNSFDMF